MIAPLTEEASTSAAKHLFVSSKQTRSAAALFRSNFLQVDRPEAVGDQTGGDVA